MSLIVNHPFISVAILLVLTVVFSIQLPRLIIDVSNEGMTITDGPEKDYYEEVKEIFG